MPQEVVDKANSAARLEGPARYGKDMDLDSPAMKAFYAELAARHTIVDPTLTVWEPLLTSDGSVISLEYAPFNEIAPPSVTRGWKIGGYPLFGGLTRDNFRESFAKMVGLVGRLHQAGGTDRCWHQRLGARTGARARALSTGWPQQRRSLADCNDRPRTDDGHGRPHRVDCARHDDGPDPRRRRCLEGSRRFASCRHRIPGRLSPRRRGFASGKWFERHAEITTSKSRH